LEIWEAMCLYDLIPTIGHDHRCFTSTGTGVGVMRLFNAFLFTFTLMIWVRLGYVDGSREAFWYRRYGEDPCGARGLRRCGRLGGRRERYSSHI
jgi:hypothetical protein